MFRYDLYAGCHPNRQMKAAIIVAAPWIVLSDWLDKLDEMIIDGSIDRDDLDKLNLTSLEKCRIVGYGSSDYYAIDDESNTKAHNRHQAFKRLEKLGT